MSVPPMERSGSTDTESDSLSGLYYWLIRDSRSASIRLSQRISSTRIHVVESLGWVRVLINRVIFAPSMKSWKMSDFIDPGDSRDRGNDEIAQRDSMLVRNFCRTSRLMRCESGRSKWGEKWRRNYERLVELTGRMRCRVMSRVSSWTWRDCNQVKSRKPKRYVAIHQRRFCTQLIKQLGSSN